MHLYCKQSIFNHLLQFPHVQACIQEEKFHLKFQHLFRQGFAQMAKYRHNHRDQFATAVNMKTMEKDLRNTFH